MTIRNPLTRASPATQADTAGTHAPEHGSVQGSAAVSKMPGAGRPGRTGCARREIRAQTCIRIGKSLNDIDALILCGGKGTRLQSVVPDRPKPMALVDGRPFLDLLVAHLRSAGLTRFVLCTGYRAEQIEAHYRDRQDATFVLSREPSPLGTGGAARHAEPLIRSDPVLILNGDSFCPVDLDALCRHHADRQAEATMVVTHAGQTEDVGSVTLDADDRITGFREKAVQETGTRHVNAGIYLFQRSVLALMPPDVPYSLETDLFPNLAAAHRLHAFVTEHDFVDIGTPERYQSCRARSDGQGVHHAQSGDEEGGNP